MRGILALILSSAAIVNCSQAWADAIDFRQFVGIVPAYSEFDAITYAASITGTTRDGVSFTIVGPANGLALFGLPGQLGSSDELGFPRAAPVLFTANVGGPTTISFDTPILSSENISLEQGVLGQFTGTMNVYNGSNLLGAESITQTTGDASLFPANSFSFAAGHPNISSIVFTTSGQDVNGYFLGNVTVFPKSGAPEPTTWAMLIVGAGLAGAALRHNLKVANS